MSCTLSIFSARMIAAHDELPASVHSMPTHPEQIIQKPDGEDMSSLQKEIDIQRRLEHPNTVKIPHPSYAWFASQLQGGPEQYILSIIHSLEPVDLRKYIPRGYCCPKLQKTAPSMPFGKCYHGASRKPPRCKGSMRTTISRVICEVRRLWMICGKVTFGG